MRYLEFYQLFKDFTVFSINDIRTVEARFYRPRLSEWKKKGYIKSLTRGHYIFSDLPVDERTLFEISNKIYSPSYVSLQMAFSYYSLIPESVYGMTAVTTRRTYRFNTSLANFTYRTVKPEFFGGYHFIRHRGKGFKIASPEKAFVDYLYLNPLQRTKEDFLAMRINKQSFAKLIHTQLIQKYAKQAGQPGLSERVRLLLECMNHA